MLAFPNKQLRADVIAAAVGMGGRVVCIGDGHHARELARAGLSVIQVGPHGPITPTRYLLPRDVRALWPGVFDATPGHVGFDVLQPLAQAYRKQLGDLAAQASYAVAAASGETALCLAIAYPTKQIVACYGWDAPPAPQWDERGPLNAIVRKLCQVQHWGDGRPADGPRRAA